MITREQLGQAFTHADASDLDEIYQPLVAAMEEFGINTPHRQAMFLAQCAHESGHFSIVEENLNYRAEGLAKIFPKYFRDRDTSHYARQPEKIANLVYGNRMGNGDESTGDGYRFRGRGLIQLTGRNNYTACSQALGVDLLQSPDYLLTAEGAARSAAWFWSQNGLNKFADADDVVGATKRINGGTIGLDERRHLYESAKRVLL